MNENKKMNYPDIRQSWGILGIVILTMILLIPVNIVLDNVLEKDISFLIYYVIAVGLPFGIVHWVRFKKTGVNKYNFNNSSMKIIILLAISTIAIQTGVSMPLVSLIPVPEFFQKMFSEFVNQYGVFSFITTVIAAPLLEELIFRGIILTGLLQRYSPAKSIIISSVLFGIVHLNPWQFISALILGLFIGWVYYKTRNLTLAIIIHSVNNLIPFIIGKYFMDNDKVMPETLTEVYGDFTNIIIISAIIVAIIGIFFLSKDFKGLKIEKWRNKSEKYSIKSIEDLEKFKL